MKISKLKVLTDFRGNEHCVFCKTTLNDTLCYGLVYKYEDLIVHYYCLLFSSNLNQNGSDEEGILGFLPKDIKKELTRSYRLHCSFCKKNGASIGCTVKSCKIKFHFPCGLANHAQNLFFNNFSSFCCNHRSIPYIPISKRNLIENTSCVICLDKLSPILIDIVWSPCCKAALYHKKCIQEVAINWGYYFRCPNCNNEKLFRQHMLNLGIHIPDQDASWELEPNAYSSLLERYSHCDANVCSCPKGRNVSNTRGKWKIILCYRCLQKGIHEGCGYGDVKNDQWACPNQSCLGDLQTCGNATKNNSDELKIQVSLQTSSQSVAQSLLLLSPLNVQNKENCNPNCNISAEMQPNYSSVFAKPSDGAVSDRLRLSRRKIEFFDRRRDFLSDQNLSRNASFINELPSSNSGEIRRLFNSFPDTSPILPSERCGRKKAFHRIKQFIDEVHPRRKSKRLKNKNSRRRSSSKKCKKTRKKQVQKNIKNQRKVIRARRKRYLIDQQIIRIYPSIFKGLKDFEICLSS